jgi:antitoxin component of RelBE/YafQ-DinJ toxin-antitoxin module
MFYMEQFPVRIEVRVDKETRDQLQDEVKKLGVSASSYIRMLLKQTLNS